MKFEYMMETEKILPYYQFPKFLLELPLSQNAKILYMLLYDRAIGSMKTDMYISCFRLQKFL